MDDLHSSNLPVTPPKHFAVDIDGTFLCFDVAHFSKNKSAFELALKAGYNLFFCTGRPHVSALAILDDEFISSTGYKGYPGIYHNGAVVYDKNGIPLRHSYFDASFMSQFCEYLLKNNLKNRVAFCDMTDSYMLCDDTTLMRAALDDVDLLKNPIVVTPAALMELKISLLIIHESDVLTNHPTLRPGVDCILKEGSFGAWDVTPCGITKAQGLLVLLDSYDCSIESCGFIGDGTNDIEAMQLSKSSFAVANAIEHVKKQAKYTLNERNDQGAFHKTMERVYGICAE